MDEVLKKLEELSTKYDMEVEEMAFLSSLANEEEKQVDESIIAENESLKEENKKLKDEYRQRFFSPKKEEVKEETEEVKEETEEVEKIDLDKAIEERT